MLPKSSINILKGKSRILLYREYGFTHKTVFQITKSPKFEANTHSYNTTLKCTTFQKKFPPNSTANFYSIRSDRRKSMETLREAVEASSPSFAEQTRWKSLVYETNNFMQDLSTKESISLEEWTKLKQMIIMTPQFNATDKNVETVTLKLMNRYGIFRFAKLFYIHLKEQSQNINFATLSLYVRFMYLMADQCTAEDFLQAEDICLTLTKNIPIFPLSIGESLICGLSITKSWRKSLEIFKDMKQQQQLSATCYLAVVEACFRNNDFETGWKIIDEIGRMNITLSIRVVRSILLDSIEKQDALLKLLNFYSKYFDRPDLQTAEIIESFAKNISKGKIKPSFTIIDKRGVCKNCKRKLESGSVTEEEFIKLRDSFLNPVLIGKDIFLKTNPAELDTFLSILKRNTPYDFVLDGLNIAFSATSAKCKDKNILARNLQAVVRYLREEKRKRLLVIGRKHMLKWPKPCIDYINRNSYFFLAEDTTNDDTFLLYATLYSGLHTHFVSRDLMRGHKFLLGDPVLESIFWRWQYQHQYLVLSIMDNGKIRFQEPVAYRQDAHALEEDDRLWHVSCKQGIEANTPGNEKLCNKSWLCLPLVK